MKAKKKTKAPIFGGVISDDEPVLVKTEVNFFFNLNFEAIFKVGPSTDSIFNMNPIMIEIQKMQKQIENLDKKLQESETKRAELTDKYITLLENRQ